MPDHEEQPMGGVTGEELDRILKLLAMQHEQTQKQITDLGKKLDDQTTQINERFDKVEQKQDKTNGRVDRAEDALADLGKVVTNILDNGCHIRREHEKEIKELGAAEARAAPTSGPGSAALSRENMTRVILLLSGLITAITIALELAKSAFVNFILPHADKAK